MCVFVYVFTLQNKPVGLDITTCTSRDLYSMPQGQCACLALRNILQSVLLG